MPSNFGFRATKLNVFPIFRSRYRDSTGEPVRNRLAIDSVSIHCFVLPERSGKSRLASRRWPKSCLAVGLCVSPAANILVLSRRHETNSYKRLARKTYAIYSAPAAGNRSGSTRGRRSSRKRIHSRGTAPLNLFIRTDAAAPYTILPQLLLLLLLLLILC